MLAAFLQANLLRVLVWHAAPKMNRKGGERWELDIEVPLTDEVVHYQYVVMAGTPRCKALHFAYMRCVALDGRDETSINDDVMQ